MTTANNFAAWRAALAAKLEAARRALAELDAHLQRCPSPADDNDVQAILDFRADCRLPDAVPPAGDWLNQVAGESLMRPAADPAVALKHTGARLFDALGEMLRDRHSKGCTLLVTVYPGGEPRLRSAAAVKRETDAREEEWRRRRALDEANLARQMEENAAFEKSLEGLAPDARERAVLYRMQALQARADHERALQLAKAGPPSN